MIAFLIATRETQTLATAREERFDSEQARRTRLAAQASKITAQLNAHPTRLYWMGALLDSLGPVPRAERVRRGTV